MNLSVVRTISSMAATNVRVFPVPLREKNLMKLLKGRRRLFYLLGHLNNMGVSYLMIVQCSLQRFVALCSNFCTVYH